MNDWSDEDVPDLIGRRAVVTGANGGLGWQTARQLAAHGARVVLACRDLQRGRDARDRLAELAPAADLSLLRLDLADLASVREFAAAVAAGGVDLLVNNAGVMAVAGRTVDGFEIQFGVNHLGHFALTGLLLPALLARPGGRVVTVSSLAHWGGRLGRLEAATGAGTGGGRAALWAGYARSKLANLLFAFELDRRVRAGGFELLSVAVHPGYAATNLQLAGPRSRGSRLEALVLGAGTALFAQSSRAGAWPTLCAATSPLVRGGMFIGPTGPGQLRGRPGPVRASPAARDSRLAGRLWAASERLTGVSWPV